MFPDSTQANGPSQAVSKPTTQNPFKLSGSANESPYDLLVRQFVGEARSQLATLTGEIALRNRVIMTNDAYVYGDLLSRSIDIAVGHDFTPVNWLRRVCEIHRVQTMGDGFSVTSSYHGLDTNTTDDPQEKQQLTLQNQKKRGYAEKRGELMESIMRDNGGEAMWARLVEGASAVGTSVLKTWYSETEGRYKMEIIEAVEHFYAIWSKSNFRTYDATAYVYQISKQKAVQDFNVPQDVATSPLGMPLAVLSSANTVEYISTQPMVTVMEVNGRIQGWCSINGILQRCPVGSETPLNVVIVGDRVKRIIDDPKYMPHFYIFPNKMIRRRPWGLPDVTTAAININQTYIETLSDWRTVASKVNFPKFKAFGFGMDTQLPKPKARTVEMIGLGEGQDIQPIQNPNAQIGSESDFQRQMAELKEEFVRETGISQVLFDNPDAPDNYVSNQTMQTAMKSISDQTAARRQLWEPIIIKVFDDAFNVLALWDDDIKELVQGDDNWYLRIQWPPELKKDDPAYQTMLLNRLNTNSISVQSFMERMGENGKEELDRIRDEMDDPFTAAIHGKMMQLLAQYKIAGPPTDAPPRVNVNLRGDLDPAEVGDIAAARGIVQPNSPFADVLGPQGNEGLTANDNTINQGLVTGQQNKSTANYRDANGNVTPPMPQNPQVVNPTSSNQPGQTPMSVPGSGATPNGPAGNVAQTNQRKRGG